MDWAARIGCRFSKEKISEKIVRDRTSKWIEKPKFPPPASFVKIAHGREDSW